MKIPSLRRHFWTEAFALILLNKLSFSRRGYVTPETNVGFVTKLIDFFTIRKLVNVVILSLSFQFFSTCCFFFFLVLPFKVWEGNGLVVISKWRHLIWWGGIGSWEGDARGLILQMSYWKMPLDLYACVYTPSAILISSAVANTCVSHIWIVSIQQKTDLNNGVVLVPWL